MNSFRQVLLFLVLAASANNVLAAWSLEPSFYLSAERNDNIYLAPQDNELVAKGGTFSPAIQAIMEEEDQSLVANANIQITRYNRKAEVLDADGGAANVNWHGSTELSRYGVAASYSSQSNVGAVLDTSGIDQQVDTKTAMVTPDWQYQFGELWSLAVNLTYKDVQYDEPGLELSDFKVVNYINYVEPSGSLKLAREITEKDTVSLTYYQSMYKGEGNGLQNNGVVCNNFTFQPEPCFINPDPDLASAETVYVASARMLEYDYTVWQIGYEHRFEANNSLSLNAGTSNTVTHNQTLPYYFDQDYQQISVGAVIPRDTEEKGQVYDISYKYQSEISRFELSAGHNRVAASSGGLDEVETARIFYFSDITERWSWSLDIKGEMRHPSVITNVNAGGATDPDYLLLTARPAISYKLSKDWSMSLSYRYNEQDYDREDQARESNMVAFTMSWREPKLLSTN